MKLNFWTVLGFIAVVLVTLFVGYFWGNAAPRAVTEPAPTHVEEFFIDDEPDDICVINGRKEIYAADFRGSSSSSLITTYSITYLNLDGDIVTQEWTVEREGPITKYKVSKRDRYILNSDGTCPSD